MVLEKSQIQMNLGGRVNGFSDRRKIIKVYSSTRSSLKSHVENRNENQPKEKNLRYIIIIIYLDERHV